MIFKRNLIALQTIVVSEINRFTRIWTQTFLPPVITMTLYLLIFGSFIGSRLAKVDGVTFMQYLAPGLIMMSVITSSYSNVVASFFSLRFMRSVEEVLVSPVPNHVLLTGFVLGGMLRGLITGLLITIIALLFTHLAIHSFIVTILMALLTASLFSLAGFANAIFAKKFDDIQIIPTFVLTPLTYLGGVFYSTQQLPTVWRYISHFNPILYIVNAFRYGILGISDMPILWAFAIVIASNIILYSLNMHLLRKGTGIKT